MDRKERFERKVALLLADKARRGEIATPIVRSSPQRMDEIELTARAVALSRGKETYYVHRRCKNGAHFSRKIAETGECVKCLLGVV